MNEYRFVFVKKKNSYEFFQHMQKIVQND